MIVGTVIPCRWFCKPGSRPRRFASSAGESSPCCSCKRAVPKRQGRPMKASDTASPQRRGTDVHREEVIIVGAGQAGLFMGYWLKRQQRSFLLLEAGPRIGESWRQRYDSLVLFSPRRYSALGGLAFPGYPDGRQTKGEMAAYLQAYAAHFSLPIQMDTGVVGMEKHGETFL